ncbi:MAG: hypothetical protein H6717_11935 [Polyangiaceae bacterium]|nr:hypothetical protein [Polyangiaceae bacterium]
MQRLTRTLEIMRKAATAFGALCLLLATPASAEPESELQLPPQGTYVHLLGAVSIGRGLRFNNPYRLATPLGNDAESLSLSATYLDLAATAAFGDPNGLQHGGSIHLSSALSGIPQEVATPSYVALLRLPPRFITYGRAGVPIVLEPDATFGLEAALGGAVLITGGLGVTAELVGSVFYGAATQEVDVTTIPMLSLQIGALIDYEVLP